MKASTLLSLALVVALIHCSIAHETEAASAPSTVAGPKDAIATEQNDMIATAVRSRYHRPYYKKRYGHGRRYYRNKRHYGKKRYYGKKKYHRNERYYGKKYDRYKH